MFSSWIQSYLELYSNVLTMCLSADVYPHFLWLCHLEAKAICKKKNGMEHMLYRTTAFSWLLLWIRLCFVLFNIITSCSNTSFHIKSSDMMCRVQKVSLNSPSALEWENRRIILPSVIPEGLQWCETSSCVSPSVCVLLFVRRMYGFQQVQWKISEPSGDNNVWSSLPLVSVSS